MKGKPIFNLQTKIILLVCGVVALSLLAANALITNRVESDVRATLGQKALDICRTMTHSPAVISGLEANDTIAIQEYANTIRNAVNVEFIVVFDMQGIRKSHPDSTRVGQHIQGGDEVPALQGHEYISYAEGTYGPSLRAFSPVFAPDGRQVGAVVVGILLGDVEKALRESHQIIYIATLIGLLIGIGFAIVLARNIKKTLFGLEPFAIAQLVEERSAMLQCVREGILAVDKNSIVTIANSEAIRVLKLAGIPGDPIGRHVAEYVPHTRLKDVMNTGQAELDQEQKINGVTILTNRVPVVVNGEIVGAIASFRDMTDMRQLAEELTDVNSYVEALRSQAHEFMNKIHVMLGLVRLRFYDKLELYITRIANQDIAESEFVSQCIHDPVLGGLLLSKFSKAREMAIDMVLAEESFLPEPLDGQVTNELVTIIGNLIDNALDAVKDSPQRQVAVSMRYSDAQLAIEVRDCGPGIEQAFVEQIFVKGYSTKSSGRGFGLFLVARAVERLNGSIKVETSPGNGARFNVIVGYQGKEVHA
ncbi:DcuS/MalK family sensor histidine kinase [Pelosinus propionicus]|uniref:histidine kinase n=1 Tax=Pelosinus propionicus DSM 13327 TaxID=1123291 RepID=A0A1I4PEQ7_9FIRM|nr:DcuS/MalK family sensor histidine kinase [Pelosinus propionicus]SFM26234.1 two-component system, CitB family, sensor histidine kinase MalK [Pelosinus propionicus DSM 13327]